MMPLPLLIDVAKDTVRAGPPAPPAPAGVLLLPAPPAMPPAPPMPAIVPLLTMVTMSPVAHPETVIPGVAVDVLPTVMPLLIVSVAEVKPAT